MTIKKKIHPEYFDKIASGEKKFELRLADWNINPGDTLILEEWNPHTQKYTGRVLTTKTTYILKTKDINFWPQKEIEKYGFQVIQIELDKN